MSKMKERLHTGELYLPGDDEIMAEQMQHLARQHAYNQTSPLEGEKRWAMLQEMFDEIGEGCYI